MADSRAVRAVVRRWADRLPTNWQQGLRQLLGRVRGRPGGEDPVLSVILDSTGEGQHLQECLDSVLHQTLTRLEVIITGSSPGISVRDPRVRTVPPVHGDSGAGIDVARGRYLTFCSARDLVPKAGYAALVQALERSGSDFAVGIARRNRFGRRSRAPGMAAAHSIEQLGVTLRDAPEAMQDLEIGNRAFRADFVRALTSASGGLGELDVVRAYLRAGAFDLLTTTTYEQRLTTSEISRGLEEQGDNLEQWIASTRAIAALLEAEAPADVRRFWLARVLDVELSDFVPYAASHDQPYRDRLRQAAQALVEAADEATLRRVRVERRLLLELVARGDWDDADRLREHVRLNGSPPPTRISAGRVLADLSGDLDLGEAELAEQQTALSAGIQRLAWSGPELIIDGWAYISGVDLSDEPPQLRAWLEDLGSGDRHDLAVEPRYDPTITRLANHPNQRYDHAGFRVVLDTTALRASDRQARWQLQVRVEVDGVIRVGSVRGVVRNGQGDRFPASPITDPTDPRRLVPVLDAAEGFVLRTRLDAYRAESLGLDQDGRLTGSIRSLTSGGSRPERVLLVQHGKEVSRGPVVASGPDLVTFAVPVPREPKRDGALELRVVGRAGGRDRVSWPAEGTSSPAAEIVAGRVSWVRSVRGHVQLDPRRRSWTAESVEVGEEAVTLVISVHGWAADQLGGVVLRGPEVTVPGLIESLVDRQVAVRFPTVAPTRWNDQPRPLPSGDYRVVIADGTRAEDELPVGSSLLAELPGLARTAVHLVTTARASDGRLSLSFGPPLTDEENGWVARRRLAAAYRRHDYVPTEQVYFQCYRGEFATDSQLAIHGELHRRGAPYELVWGIADHSVALPVGARPVIIGSREWYDVLGSARYLCANVDFDRFFLRRDHQHFLQTFHGYPFKSMGISFWRAKNMTEPLLAYECHRRNAAWTSIVVPAPFCEELYRREYRYTGEVLVSGYPRDDVLAVGDAEVARATRERLGVAPDTTLVLYAPTWRESAATSSWTAAAFDALDLDELRRGLGPAYTVLLRGHLYTRGAIQNAAADQSAAAVIDVTGYPEINDLVLAADVAVLDYSSLRFDWLLTGKPMIFFVPDRESYLSQRTALFDFAPTAPGPWTSTTAEVVDALRRLESVDAEYAEARRRANDEFNGLNDGHATRRVVDAFFDAPFYAISGDADRLEG